MQTVMVCLLWQRCSRRSLIVCECFRRNLKNCGCVCDLVDAWSFLLDQLTLVTERVARIVQFLIGSHGSMTRYPQYILIIEALKARLQSDEREEDRLTGTPYAWPQPCDYSNVPSATTASCDRCTHLLFRSGVKKFKVNLNTANGEKKE